MSSLTSNPQSILYVKKTSILKTIATFTNNNLDHHFPARIIAGNAGKFDMTTHKICLFLFKYNKFLENLHEHLESMYNILQPGNRLTLVC